MKNIIYIKLVSFVILLITPLSSVGQFVENLEQINGFREIKFNRKLQEYRFFEPLTESNGHFTITNSIMNTIIRTHYLRYSHHAPYNCQNCNDYIMTPIQDNFSSISGQKILKLGVSTYKDTIYEISFFVESKPGIRTLVDDHINAFGKPNSQIGYGWDFFDFNKAELDDQGLYMAWFSESISLSITDIDADSKFKGSKRCAYMISYTYTPIADRALAEDVKNTPVKDPLREFK
jgi:hypothetical protein